MIFGPRFPEPQVPAQLHPHVVPAHRQYRMVFDTTDDLTPGLVVHWKTVSPDPNVGNLLGIRTLIRVASLTPFLGPDGTPLCDGWLGIFSTGDGAEQSENAHGLAIVTTTSLVRAGRIMAWASPLTHSDELWNWFTERPLS